MRCGYRHFFGQMGVSQISWPLAQISIGTDDLRIESKLGTVKIRRDQVVECKPGWLSTRIVFATGEDKESVDIWGVGVRSALSRWGTR
jgi:hypothetical protein